MKLLVIHSNKLFFGKAPNFYDWLAEKRGLENKYRPLKEKYTKERHKSLLLKETYKLVVGGLIYSEFKRYCEEYCSTYLDKKIIVDLQQLMKNIQILIFGSYPRGLYKFIKDKSAAHKVFGVIGIVDKNNKIVNLAGIKIKHEIGKTELSEKFSLPDRYGLLEFLIYYITENNVLKENIIVLGKGATVESLHKVVGRVITSLEEI